jgi:glycosyltransferase involved in cell wall biosynthesis
MAAGMRVCLVTPYSPREVSGVGQVVVNLAKGLKEKGHEVTTFTKSTEEDAQEIPGLVEIDYVGLRLIGGLLLAFRILWRILKDRRQFDIFHLHSISSLTLATAIFGSILGRPRALTLHGKFPPFSNKISGAIFKLKERMTLAFSSKVTCVSQDTKDFYRLDSAIVVRNGVDTSRFLPDDGERQRIRAEMGIGRSIVLLFIGRWVAHKGIYDLIELTKDLTQKGHDLKLLLVGSGEEENVRKAIGDSSLKERAIPVGRVDDVVPYYQGSDLLILFTSSLEGIPLTMLEAMACQVPCVATSVSGIGEVISDGVDGFLIQEGDKAALEKAVVNYIDNQEHFADMRRNAREKVKSEFDLNGMTEGYMGIFESLI